MQFRSSASYLVVLVLASVLACSVARPGHRSPCQDGSRPSCSDGTVIQRPARGGPPPACDDGTTPLCDDGSEPQPPQGGHSGSSEEGGHPHRSPCQDDSRPSCSDGTVIQRPARGDPRPTCTDGTTPLCEDGSEPQRPRHSSEEEEDSLVKGRFGGWGKPEGQGHGRPGGHKKPKHGPKPSLCYLSINDNVTIDQPCAFDGELFECVEPKRHHLKPQPDSNEGMLDGMFDDMPSWSDLFDGVSDMFQDIFGSDEDEDMSRHHGGRRPWWKSSEEEDDQNMEHHKQNITVKVCVPLNCTADSDCSGDNMCLAGKPKRGQWQSQGQWQWGGQGGQWSDSDSNEERPDKRHGGRCEITCAQKVYASACHLTDAADAVVRNVACPPFQTCNTEHGRVFTYQGKTLTAHHCQKAGETRFPMFHECAGVKPPRNNTTSDD